MEILFSSFGFDARYRNSAAEMNPFPSLSNTRNASRISSSLSVSFILRAIIVRNSGKSIVPLPENHLKNEVSIRRKKTIRTVSVDFVDHVLKLGFSWILSQTSHDGSWNENQKLRRVFFLGKKVENWSERTQFFSCDCSIAVLVEKRKSLFEFSDLFFS